MPATSDLHPLGVCIRHQSFFPIKGNEPSFSAVTLQLPRPHFLLSENKLQKLNFNRMKVDVMCLVLVVALPAGAVKHSDQTVELVSIASCHILLPISIFGGYFLV